MQTPPPELFARALRCVLVALIFAAARVNAAFPTVALKAINLHEIHSPTVITHAGDGSGRLFICDQPGKIFIFQNGALLATPFLDLSNASGGPIVAMNTSYSERGLLGLAFHPGFANPASPGYRKFYLNYTKTYVDGVDAPPLGPLTGTNPGTLVGNSVSTIAEFQVSAADPNVADASSERRLLQYTQPQSNHNGGQVEFGPEIGPNGERYLYIGVGDGGSQQDNNLGHTGGDNTSPRPTNGLGNAQDKTRLFGKILRIDPLGTNGPGGQYGIPIDNPFAGAGGAVREEIFSYGMRNPWRFSFDKRPGGTNRLFCGDVGGDRTEEIDLIVSGGNYGWRYYEGVEMPLFSSGSPTNPMPNPGGPFIAPIARYAHPGQTVESPALPQLGLSVTGGFVYRGPAIPALQGKYVFGDYGSTSGASNGRMMGLEETPPGSGTFTLTQAIPLAGLANPIIGQRILTLGEDESGEIYVGMKTNAGVLQLGTDGLPAGGIYKVVPLQRYTATIPAQKDNTIFAEDIPLSRSYSDGQGYLYVGRTGSNFGPYVRRALVAFDIAGRLPAGSIIQSAQLKLSLNKSGGSAPGTGMAVHALTETWGEGTSINTIGGYGAAATTDDATWKYRFYNTSMWSAQGGTYDSTPSASTVIGSPGVVSWASTTKLVSDVQGWLDTPVSNAGWILIGDEFTDASACQFDSVQSGSVRPALVVSYDSATPPIQLNVPGNITTEQTGLVGAVATFTVTATNAQGAPLTPSVQPPSGTTFPLGVTTVNISVSDGLGNTATGSFTVTVIDTTKPVLTVPGAITREATSANGAVVTFTPTATDVSGTPTIVSVPASGSTFPLGQTTVNVTATDRSGNATQGSFTVTVQDTTMPVLMLPDPVVAEAANANGAVVSFSATATDAVSTPQVMVVPASGSTFPLGPTMVNVTATDVAGNVAMGSFMVTVQDSTPPLLTVPAAIVAEAAGASGAVVTFSTSATDAVSTPLVLAVPASGSTFPLGPTTVNVTATDVAGNVAMKSFTVTVRDSVAPVISGHFPARTTSVTTMPDYTTQATTSDNVGVASVTQTPAPGSPLALGPTTVVLTARDAAGNEASVSFKLTRYPPDPAHTPIASETPVPGAGDPGGAPTGSIFTHFGVPAINDAGELAFLATWASPVGDGVGIFAGNPPALVAKAGDVPPSVAPATFRTFMDPVLDAGGHVAFLATIAGRDVTAANDMVLATNAFAGGVANAVAREGAGVNVPGAPKLKAFTDVSIVQGEVVFTATLMGGRPPVLATNDTAAFRISNDGRGPVLMVREGQPHGVTKVSAFKLLSTVGGSPGQGRALGPNTATFLALLANGSQALVTETGGVLTELATRGTTTGGTLLPSATFKSFGVVAADAPRTAFLATLNAGVGGVTASKSRGIFLGAGTAFEPVARVTDPVLDVTGAKFAAFLDPVLAPGAAAIAFPGTLAGPGFSAGKNLALFYRPEGGTLRTIARQGAPSPAGASWQRFISLALPGGSSGPLFHATLARKAGVVSAANDAGVWAVDSTGTLRQLFRKGDTIAGKPLASFTVLNAVRGSAGATRAFNNGAQVAWRANFTDGSTAIIVTTVP